MALDRYHDTATLLRDGRVLIAGGSTLSSAGTAAAELYDPATGTFGSAGAMTVARSWPTATLLPDGRVLVAGGFTNDSSGSILASAELYTP